MENTLGASGPLAGVRVVDLTTVILGPYATQILAELGADVIKVEPPAGDNIRFAAPMRHPGMGHIFLHLNRGKRSIVLDLKQPEGREALLALAREADVLVYNVRPQAMARLGLTYDDVRAVNPRLVYVGAYGFRADGPYGAKAAYDDIIQGLIGLPWLLGELSGGRPRFVPSTIADRITGLNAVAAVTAALFQRERTGAGQAVEVTMLEGLTHFVLGDHMGGRTFEPPIAPMGYPRLLAPDRNPYRTQDGWLCLLVYNDKQWQSFFRAVGDEGLPERDARFATQASRSESIADVYAYVAERIAERTTAEWLEVLAEADIPAMPLHSLEDLLADEHLAATGFFTLEEHPTEGLLRLMAPGSRWPGSAPTPRRPAPLLGEHSVEILREHGYTDEAIDDLVARSVTVAGAA